MLTVTEDIANIRIAYPGLGKKIRAYRKGKGYSQEKLSELLDVSWMTVQRWEHDQRGIKLYILERVARLFEVDLDYLMTYTKD